VSKNIKAVILAAGKGTRMKELTKERPKPMLEVGGRPVLEVILTALRDVGGVREFCIVTGYRPEAIKEYFADGKRFGVKVSYVTQEVQDGTGRAPAYAKEFVGNDSFFLSYGDILTEPKNYRGMVESFTTGKCDAVLTVRAGDDVSKGAAVMFDQDHYLVDLIEKPPPGSVKSPWNNSGIYIFTPKLFEYIPRIQKSVRGEYELTDGLRMMAKDGLKVKCHELKGYWLDVRDPEVLAEAQKLFAALAR
jgi:dTDP-glucose pyrophosphorylase